MRRIFFASSFFVLSVFLFSATGTPAQAQNTCGGTCGTIVECNSQGGQLGGNQGCPNNGVCCLNGSGGTGTGTGSGSGGSGGASCGSGAGTCTTISACGNQGGSIGSDTSCTGGQICCMAGSTGGTTQGGSTTVGGVPSDCSVSGTNGYCGDICGQGYDNTPNIQSCTGKGVTYCCVPRNSGTGTSTGTGSSTTTTSGSGGCPANFVNRAGVCFPQDTGLSEAPVGFLLMRFMNWLLAIFGFIAIIAFVISGLQYLTAAGDEKTVETAKRNMQYSIIGIIVALSGWIIIVAIDRALSGSWLF